MKFNETTVNDLVTHLKAGNSIKDSCLLAGISRETYYAWKKEHPDFSDIIKKAEAECKARNIALIQQDKSWQSKAWWLERKYPEEFKERRSSEVESKDLKEVADAIRKIIEDN